MVPLRLVGYTHLLRYAREGTVKQNGGNRAVRVGAVVGASCLLFSGVGVGTARGLTANSATMTGNSAAVPVSESAGLAHHRAAHNSDADFDHYAKAYSPASVAGLAGTASASVSQDSTIRAGDGTSFPADALAAINTSGSASAAVDPTGRGTAVPNARASSELRVNFTVSGTAPVYISLHLHAINPGTRGCASVGVRINGPTPKQFIARVGNAAPCSGTHHLYQNAEHTITLAAGSYELVVGYLAHAASPSQPVKVSTTARVSVNFFPPEASGISPTLSGHTATFDAATSSAVDGRHIVKWIWNFGDGETTTTRNPVVAHRYPLVAVTTGWFPSLQVLDSAGALSQRTGDWIGQTVIVRNLYLHSDHVVVLGIARPQSEMAGRTIYAALEKRRSGKFVVIARESRVLDSSATYGAGFPRSAGSGTCRVVMSYPGDPEHLAERRPTRTYSC
jgi:hypothetical protein